MKIESLIHSLFANNPKVYNVSGDAVDYDVLVNEYRSIKNYILTNAKEDSRVGILVNKDYYYLLTLLACMESGVAFVPMMSDYPEQRVSQLVDIASIDIMISNTNLRQALAFDSSEVETKFELSENRLLYIIFTSGSTGVPKGVEIIRSSYENFLSWVSNTFDEITTEDRVLNTTEYTFDVSLMDVALLLTKNVHFFVSNFKSNIFQLCNELEKNKITAIATVPNNFSLMAMFKRVDLSALKYAFIAGSRFPLSLYKDFAQNLPDVRVFNCYGPTEFTIYCLFKEMKIEDEDVFDGCVSIGSPLTGLGALVVDEQMNSVQDGQKGELVVTGPQLMRGYVNNKEKTDEVVVTIDGLSYYRTGDLVFKNGENYFVVGRLDDTVKISGFRVNLSDVDTYIQTLPYVANVATVTQEVKSGESRLVAFMDLTKDLSNEEIYSDLKKILPEFQLPKKIVKLDSLPVNNSGKIDKKRLKKMTHPNKLS